MSTIAQQASQIARLWQVAYRSADAGTALSFVPESATAHTCNWVKPRGDLSLPLVKQTGAAKSSEVRGDVAHRQDKEDAHLSFDHRDTIHPDTRLLG